MRLIERLGRTVVVLAFGIALIGTPVGAQEEPPEASEIPVKQIKMFAENWKWTPNTIRVAAGQKVSLEIQNVDSPHRFYLKKLGLNVLLPENETTIVEFTAGEPGTYRWRCKRPCGNGCAKMTGKLIVE